MEHESGMNVIENLHEKVFFNQKTYCRGLKSPKVCESVETTKIETNMKIPKVPGLPKAEAIRTEKNKIS